MKYSIALAMDEAQNTLYQIVGFDNSQNAGTRNDGRYENLKRELLRLRKKVVEKLLNVLVHGGMLPVDTGCKFICVAVSSRCN